MAVSHRASQSQGPEHRHTRRQQAGGLAEQTSPRALVADLSVPRETGGRFAGTRNYTGLSKAKVCGRREERSSKTGNGGRGDISWPPVQRSRETARAPRLSHKAPRSPGTESGRREDRAERRKPRLHWPETSRTGPLCRQQTAGGGPDRWWGQGSAQLILVTPLRQSRWLCNGVTLKSPAHLVGSVLSDCHLHSKRINHRSASTAVQPRSPPQGTAGRPGLCHASRPCPHLGKPREAEPGAVSPGASHGLGPCLLSIPGARWNGHSLG